MEDMLSNPNHGVMQIGASDDKNAEQDPQFSSTMPSIRRKKGTTVHHENCTGTARRRERTSSTISREGRRLSCFKQVSIHDCSSCSVAHVLPPSPRGVGKTVPSSVETGRNSRGVDSRQFKLQSDPFLVASYGCTSWSTVWKGSPCSSPSDDARTQPSKLDSTSRNDAWEQIRNALCNNVKARDTQKRGSRNRAKLLQIPAVRNDGGRIRKMQLQPGEPDSTSRSECREKPSTMSREAEISQSSRSSRSRSRFAGHSQQDTLQVTNRLHHCHGSTEPAQKFSAACTAGSDDALSNTSSVTVLQHQNPFLLSSSKPRRLRRLTSRNGRKHLLRVAYANQARKEMQLADSSTSEDNSPSRSQPFLDLLHASVRGDSGKKSPLFQRQVHEFEEAIATGERLVPTARPRKPAKKEACSSPTYDATDAIAIASLKDNGRSRKHSIDIRNRCTPHLPGADILSGIPVASKGRSEASVSVNEYAAVSCSSSSIPEISSGIANLENVGDISAFPSYPTSKEGVMKTRNSCTPPRHRRDPLKNIQIQHQRCQRGQTTVADPVVELLFYRQQIASARSPLTWKSVLSLQPLNPSHVPLDEWEMVARRTNRKPTPARRPSLAYRPSVSSNGERKPWELRNRIENEQKLREGKIYRNTAADSSGKKGRQWPLMNPMLWFQQCRHEEEGQVVAMAKMRRKKTGELKDDMIANYYKYMLL